MLRLLIVGDSTYKIYADAFYRAANKIEDVDAEIFDFGELNIENINKNFLAKVEVHYKNGIFVRNLNKKLIKRCLDERYDIVFFYSCSIIYADSIKKVQNAGIYTAVYCNDNPFSEYYRKYIWKHVINSLPNADIVYSYRQNNMDDYYSHGAKKVKLLRSYYIEERNYYIPDKEIMLDIPEVVFIGHKEDDERESYIKSLLDEGIKVGLNQAWNGFERGNPMIVRFSSDQTIYNQIINKAKIAIVFLSKINRDTYTRRCFEIPATKTMMIAPYTEDLASMYEENKEIVFFREKQEFVQKIKYFVNNNEDRERIAEKGYQRLIRDGHEVGDRIRQIIGDYKKLKEESIIK